jgi:4-hydroxy-4-methyl-2-oxoglutarate aldolase
MAIVVRHTPRTDPGIVTALGRFGVATIHEAQGRRGLLGSHLRPIYRPVRIAGTALTCEVAPGDNWSIHVAVEQAQPGDILVVTPTAMQFPVWSKCVNAQGTVKETPGNVQTPIVCAGALIHPGDVIVADDDGVVVVPRGDAAMVAEKSERREENEREKRSRLASGELGLDMYSMREKLERQGLRYVDRVNP